MRTLLRFLLLLFVTASAAPFAHADIRPEWTTPLKPFQIADNLYYVGSQDLGAFLVRTPQGNILINANLETSPPQIKHSVEELGFRWADIKILLDGQAHYDHLAGGAQIVRETHAKNMVMDGDAEVARTGGHADFMKSSPNMIFYPPVPVDRVLHDGDTVTLGGVTLTAHKTPGHTRGCTTWTMRVHVPGEPATQMRNVVIVGGWAPWNDYQLVDKPGHPASYPGIAADFQRTFHVLRGLPCDIFLGAHGSYFSLAAKLKRIQAEGPKVWIDPAGYRAAVDGAEADFDKAYAKQKQG